MLLNLNITPELSPGSTCLEMSEYRCKRQSHANYYHIWTSRVWLVGQEMLNIKNRRGFQK